MSTSLLYLYGALIGYLCGSVPTAYIIARLIYKINIFEHGSKNMGATNVYRVLGLKPFAVTLFFDILKGMASVYLAVWLLGVPAAVFISAAGAIAGHSLSFWVRFKGGKGVATGLGIFLALAPRAAIGCLIVFIIILLISRMVSMGSILAAAALPFLIYHFQELGAVYTPYLIGFAAVVAVFVIWRHKANIVRIAKGQENKLGKKSEAES